MRRIVCLLILAVLTLGLTACGGDDGPGGDPRAQALALVPRDAPLAAVLQTSGKPVDQALDLVRGFPGGGLGLARLEQEIAKEGVDYGRDVKPVLGNPVALGLASTSGNAAVIALVVRDEKALDRVFDAVRRKGGRKAGSYRKAVLYTTADATAIARRGSVLVLASNRQVLRAALDREAAGTGMRPQDFDKERAGLPGDALLTAVGRIDTALRGPDSATARRVPFVGALRDYAFTVAAAKDGVTMQGRVRADGGDLTDADAPIATGDATPRLAQVPGPALGLRDLTHVIEFAQRAGQAVDPSGFSDFERAKATVGAAAGVDVDAELLGQLASDATVTLVDGNHVALRATARDPGRLRRALTRLQAFAGRGIAGAGVPRAKVRAAGDGAWTVEQDGVVVGAYAVLGHEFVAGNVDLAALRGLAARPTAAVRDAKGALSVRVPAAYLRSFAQAQTGLPSAIADAVLARLGDARGWMSATRAGLAFTARLDVR